MNDYYTERARKALNCPETLAAVARAIEEAANARQTDELRERLNRARRERDNARGQLERLAVALGESVTAAANPPYLQQAAERLRAERDTLKRQKEVRLAVLESLRYLEKVVCEEADGLYAYASDCPADAVRELGRLARAHKSEKDNWVGALRNVEAQLREAERELGETRARLDRALARGDALRTRLDALLGEQYE